jgi:hypothetical protein
MRHSSSGSLSSNSVSYTHDVSFRVSTIISSVRAPLFAASHDIISCLFRGTSWTILTHTTGRGWRSFPPKCFHLGSSIVHYDKENECEFMLPYFFHRSRIYKSSNESNVLVHASFGMCCPTPRMLFHWCSGASFVFYQHLKYSCLLLRLGACLSCSPHPKHTAVLL